MQNRDALMELLTFKSVEEMVKQRVKKKAMVFGQEVCLGDSKGKYKVDPSVVSRLYEEWVMPLTKKVQVEYLLCRLDWNLQIDNLLTIDIVMELFPAVIHAMNHNKYLQFLILRELKVMV